MVDYKLQGTYPQVPKSDQVDLYPGAQVADPYRILEDPHAPETQAWIEAQNQITFDFLAKISARSAIHTRLTQLWNYEKYGTPFKRGDRYFYFKNDGLQNQSVLYTLTDLDAPPTVLLDPNTLSEDGTVALTGLAVSEEGRFLAYALSTAGSDWKEWKVRNIDTGEDLPDHLKWSKFSGASWLPDSSGFFYSRYAEPQDATQFEETNYFQRLYFHALGTAQAEDRLIYERSDQKEWGFDGTVTDDGRYLIISVWQGTDSRNLVFYQDLQHPNGEIIELISTFEARYSVLGNTGSTLWVQTDLDAPRGRVMAIDLNHPKQSDWREVIPETQDTLETVSILNHQFVAAYLKDAHSEVRIFDQEGQFLRSVELPGLGSVGGFEGKPEDTETFYSFTSYTIPTRIYHYDLTTGESQLFRQPQVAFDPNDYETQQVFVTSKDGTRIPLFITSKKGLKQTGDRPTYLYGYGGFNVSLTPVFSPGMMVWMEMGGIYAVANLRGGGEYGEEWHAAGKRHNKQNVFDDFIAAAEWLIAEDYTSRQKLAIAGGSNGGLLVGACITQRPDLFAAALPAVGVMDMLRFHKFTIGWAWCAEYGSPDDPEDFKTLYAYSPLHQIKPGTSYPATLITTADHDDRVVPAHSFKFAAALQAAQGGEAPILIRIETKAGHGAGKPTTKQIEEMGDRFAFLVAVLDMDVTLDLGETTEIASKQY
jgi:prolyl oligopeptidase